MRNRLAVAAPWDNEARPKGAGNTSRPLTRSLDLGKEGLAVNATRECDGTCKPKCRACKLTQDREYHRANPHRQWIASYRTRAKHFGFTPVVEEFTREDVILAYGNHCVYCDVGEFEELDHATPVCKGGTHSLGNVRPACAKCNQAKSRVDGCPDDRRIR